ncbi:cell division protein DedD [Photobacterium damselae subsp. damselae]|uniref:cell division protein DedD n=1 Tax=Photobacterium damselae TaxID=38293 RepID=UPI000D0727AB|nr:cell division protein DedD [Photobacterium damselae]KAB1511957.1 cell division protein DedD [Photobacterium damselae subsp. damselae]NVH46903.1 cell division protein DedD [Photobacterium damselae subsp. damselae]PSB89770.1 cell division protein DedD [Photobacterium damselae subsp. damselae]
MASKFQNRLIGTVILVSVGVVVLPDIFDGQKEHYKEEFASIPLQPKAGEDEKYTTVPDPTEEQVALPEDPAEVTIDHSQSEHKQNTDSSTTETTPVVAVKPQPKPEPKPVVKPEPKPQPKPVVKPQPKPEKPAATTSGSWAIQLGVFSNVSNAQALVEKLQAVGYQAHLSPKNPKSGQYVRVIVGPETSKDKLTGQIGQLQKITGLKGRVFKFNPLNP